MTDTSEETVSGTPVTTQEKIVRKIEIGISENRNVGVNIVGEFKTYEFYGVLLTTLMDVFVSNLVNDLNRKGSQDLSSPKAVSPDMEAKAERLRRIKEDLLNSINTLDD